LTLLHVKTLAKSGVKLGKKRVWPEMANLRT